MGSYLGRHAQLFDLFYESKPYADEAAAVAGLIARHVGGGARDILELGCGTGRHALQLAQRGHRVIATDYSADMLQVARARGVESRADVEFLLQDMRELELGSRRFDAVVCLFDAIGYVQTNDALARVLSGVHAHLRDGGVFVFEFWHAPALLRAHDPVRVRRWQLPDREVVRISETRLEPTAALGHVAYSVYEHFTDGHYTSFRETQTNRYFLVPEMRALLERAALEPLAFHAGFSMDQHVTGDTFHVVAVARRRVP